MRDACETSVPCRGREVMARWRMRHTLLSLAAVAVWAAGPEAQTARPSTYFDSAALLADVKALSADTMNGRAVGSTDGAKARAYLIRRLTAAGLVPIGTSFESPFTFTRGGRNAPPAPVAGVNLVGVVKGRTTPDQYLLVSAHYDHLPPRNGVVMNGADDNASGAAALVAVTQYFVRHRPAVSVLILACDGEEAGLQGAAAFAAMPPVPAASILANVNLDMIGRDPDGRLFAVGTKLVPGLKAHVEAVAATAPVTLRIGHDDPADKALDDWTRDSDHYAFWEAWKLPFVYLGVEDERQHHRPTDDYETLDHDFYVRAVETAIQLVSRFDAHATEIASLAATRRVAHRKDANGGRRRSRPMAPTRAGTATLGALLKRPGHHEAADVRDME